MANVSLWGAVYADVPTVLLPKQGGGTAAFDDTTISSDAATASDIANGKKAWVNGSLIVGTGSGGGGTPAISVVDTTDSHGGTVRTITALDISDTTAVASDVASGKYFYTANGTKTQGTASGGGGATQHTIHLEFDDSTDTDIEVDYDDSVLGTIITAYNPSEWTYNNKIVTSASLDNVEWYTHSPIPLNTQLIDYTKLSDDTAIDSSGEATTQQWFYTSDYTAVDPSMTFTYKANAWFYIGVYDSNKTVLRAIYVYTDGSDAGIGNDIYTGTLSGAKLVGAAYVRITSNYDNSTGMSLIRTA